MLSFFAVSLPMQNKMMVDHPGEHGHRSALLQGFFYAYT